MYEHLDLFSGIGGFSLAAESVGFKTIGFSEIDPYASAVLSKWWPSVTNYGDIRNITKDTVGSVDLITAGFPCQPFSVAGQRRGDSDERHLWPELCRVISEVRPTWCLLENVPGLLSSDAGRVFGDVLRDLAAVGYDALWNCVPASAIGANHKRDRLWIVAYSRSFSEGRKVSRGNEKRSSNKPIGCRKMEPNASNSRLEGVRKWGNEANGDWWKSEPTVGRVAHGVPKRLQRLKCIGNAIVPQVAQIFLKGIKEQIERQRL